MKQKLKIIMGVSTALVLAATAPAQPAPAPQPDAADVVAQQTFQDRVRLIKESAQASDVIGMTVENQQHEKLGRVRDLYINLKSGRIVEVVLSGGSHPLTAVPPQVLHQCADQKRLCLDVSKEKFLGAPGFADASGDEVTESNRVSSVYGYYGEEAYFVADPEKLWTTNANGTPNRDGTRSDNQGRNAAIARQEGDDSNTISTRDPDGKQTGNYYSNQNHALNSWSALGNVRKVSHLMGMSIRNLQDVKLGKVDNFIVDLPAGRVAAVIMSTGAFLGIGGDYSAAPATSFHYDPIRHDLQLDATPADLASGVFAPAEWPNYSLAGYTNGIYYPYKAAPYDNNTAPRITEISGQNERNQDSRQLAPVTQGTSAADEALQTQIRNEIAADDTLSMNAKHILVITTDGRVTLRGPVNTSDEKHLIGVIADRIAHTGNVDNELQVQLTSN